MGALVAGGDAMTGNVLSLADDLSTNGIEALQLYLATQKVTVNPEAQHEMQLSIMRVLNNAPAGITLHQKQIALICAIEELAKAFPHDCQTQKVLAVIATMILGPRLLIGVSAAGGGIPKECTDVRVQQF
jgi:hypothetical protein